MQLRRHINLQSSKGASPVSTNLSYSEVTHSVHIYCYSDSSILFTQKHCVAYIYIAIHTYIHYIYIYILYIAPPS